MSLKKLVVKGFKSFADQTTLEFNEGVTAVVGPNGSGKSNIIEAIQWVMGEQSAKSLRGGKMYDVIFSGSSKRKPMNIAQATLVFDNSSQYLGTDFEEVSVTRRLSRSGESDYFINKQSCRLKDIHELFMDSGLGRESFSIISQGQVEAIFNAKPKERRAIFEEAAGVFKYKLQKKEAQEKLETTQDNLDRVQDILYELEKQVGPLAEQADIAQSYLEQKEELTDLDIRLTVQKIENLKQKIEEAKEKKETSEQEGQALETDIQENASRLQNLKDQLKTSEQDRDQVQGKILELVKDLERTESSLALFDEKARHKEAFIQEKDQAIAYEQENIDQLSNRLRNFQRDEASLKNDLQACKIEYDLAKKKISYFGEGKDKRIEELQADYVDLMQSLARVNNQTHSTEREASRSQLNLEKYQKELANYQKEAQATQKEKDQLDQALQAQSHKIDNYLNDYKTLNQGLQAQLGEVNHLQKQLHEKQNVLDKSEAKLNSLKEMQENYAGYFQGVKSVLRQRKELGGIVGTIAELIQIPQEYLEAIDTVLGGSSQFIVVEDEKAGRQAIAYLKEMKAGRATFLPLTTIKGRTIPQRSLAQAKDLWGFIGLGSDLIRYQDQYSQVIENLLGSTVVAENLQAANAIAKALNYRNRVVSLDGNMINAGGSMTGGGGKRSSNQHLFSQQSEIKDLENKIKQMQDEVDQDQTKLAKLQETVKTKEDQLTEMKELGDQARYQENTLSNQVQQVDDKLKRLTKQTKAVQFELSNAQEDYQENKELAQDLADEKVDLEKRIESNQRELDDLNREKEFSKQRIEELRERLDLYQNHLANYREKYASVQASIQNLQEQIKGAKEQIQKYDKDKKNFSKEIEETSKEDLEKKRSAIEEHHQQTKAKENQIKNEIKELSDQINQSAQELDQRKNQSQWVKEQINKEEVNLSKHEVSMDHLLDYLVEEYECSYEEAKRNEPLGMDFEQANKKVKLLKKGIDELGPINLGAIEEYQNVSERYEFLNQQHQDLIEAKDSLFNTMDEMDSEVKRRFKETFTAIKKEFTQVFPKMFGGGRAELQLTEPDDLLATGVEIVAQPPGKKLTSLSLLSGGERALTAISLLFAIIQVNPLPFVILDEAEAALDEANVERFGKYLQSFEEKTQFIVITHRQGTMEEADRLYGVTMQEKGVSALLSVNMNDIEAMELD